MRALPRSDIATLSHLDTRGANPGWPFLLRKAVLSPPGNCAGIPPARRVPLCPIPSPSHQTAPPLPRHGQRGSKRGEAQACSCALIPSTWPGAQMCTQATATIWAMRVPSGTQHLQTYPYYLTWRRTNRPNKDTSGEGLFTRSDQTKLGQWIGIALSAFHPHIKQKPLNI